ncbi:hypothetical protein QZH41_006622 [Actinostola sp. cb2023]|nr:hypothetical protein QZH41_006622 [Actinostola sp. cb2023]
MTTLGEEHDIELTNVKNRISKENANRKILECNIQEWSSAQLPADQCSTVSIQASSPAKELDEFKSTCHEGYTIVFDNIDMEIRPKNMTMVNQNKDVHWVNHKMVQNRVSGNGLSYNGQHKELLDVPNIKFLPTVRDHKRQRQNYIVLVSRILVNHFECFSSFRDACLQHIPHKYSEEMVKKSEKVPLGIIFKNENENQDMLKILQQFQTYLPRTADNDYDKQIVTGRSTIRSAWFMALDRDSIFLWTFSKRGGTTSLKNKTFDIFEELQRCYTYIVGKPIKQEIMSCDCTFCLAAYISVALPFLEAVDDMIESESQDAPESDDSEDEDSAANNDLNEADYLQITSDNNFPEDTDDDDPEYEGVMNVNTEVLGEAEKVQEESELEHKEDES